MYATSNTVAKATAKCTNGDCTVKVNAPDDFKGVLCKSCRKIDDGYGQTIDSQGWVYLHRSHFEFIRRAIDAKKFDYFMHLLEGFELDDRVAARKRTQSDDTISRTKAFKTSERRQFRATKTKITDGVIEKVATLVSQKLTSSGWGKGPTAPELEPEDELAPFSVSGSSYTSDSDLHDNLEKLTLKEKCPSTTSDVPLLEESKPRRMIRQLKFDMDSDSDEL
ncbi:hypothetical protein LEN26_007345 [Aphanomyces euteiches]|nr:hypothetical protein AeMF1_018325 [Aphanomyces euteiches]KAH9132632.1 hypothetical protein LEN26_007345 [Aphanomyces euteiches]KAH9179409.1 hypothetical protein AeNC1_017323 [Aphanomyces euteiches]